MTKPLIAPGLTPGDGIGIVAPAGQLADQNRFEAGVNILQEMGFKVSFPRDLWPGDGYLADSDSRRVKEFNHQWGNPDIKAVLSLRGGFGSTRMIEGIDFRLLQQNPKMFIGFSDITILHNYINSRTGLITLHGPVLTSLTDCSKDALERFYHCLRGKWHSPVKPCNIEILRGGPTINGVLKGGNLSSLMTLLATPYDSSWEGAILLLEDINEPLYKIDRMLTQLSQAGKLKGVSGILLGDFFHTSIAAPVDKLRYHEALWDRLLELTAHEKTVIWAHFPSGHFHDNFTVPLGAQARLNSKQGELSFPR